MQEISVPPNVDRGSEISAETGATGGEDSVQQLAETPGWLGFVFVAAYAFPAVGNSDLAQITDVNTRFANNFYRAISKNNKENILFCPLSAHIALSMLYQGAAANTASKFANVRNLQNVTLHTANKIYVANEINLKSSFKDTITKSFSSEVEPINFGDSQDAARNINGWVANKTNSKITKLFDPEDLDASTVLVLLNAVYFKGGWSYPFWKNQTTTEKFYVSDSEQIDCQMMHLSLPLNWREADELDAQVLQLYYENQEVSLVIILPNDVNGIDSLENKLTETDLSTITNGVNDGYMILLSLPKFKIETTMNLQPILKEMGLEVIFEPTADFSEISENRQSLHVSKAIQTALIEVNEEGTDAAVASRFSVFLSSPPPFKADHPFIILLQAKHNGLTDTLFYGRVMKPTSD